jgi:PAS domain S-box-containing protein
VNPSRILVVEDEAIVSMEIEERLTAMGYRMAGTTASGEQALELARQERPDLVLMDIRLQGIMDGITVAEDLRQQLHLPVIFLTAYSEEATLERAKLAEPYGYLIKPFDDRELKSAIEIALYKHQAEEEMRRLNRLYDVLSQVNQCVVRVKTREELLPTVCRVAVERGAIDLAWIGWLDEDTSRISPVAYFGKPGQFLSEADFFADDRPEGQGAPGKAIREGRPFVCNACPQDMCLYPVTKQPAVFGFQSCGSFPFRFQGQVCGALNLCVAESGFFREREIQLLKEVATDISFALDKIEGEAQREQAEARVFRQSSVLDGINKVLMEALSSHTEEDLGRMCLAVAEEVTGSRFGFLGEINAEGRFDHIAVSDPGWGACKITDDAGRHMLPTSLEIHGIYGRVLKDGKGFFTNDPASHPDHIGLPPGHPLLDAFLGVPLMRDGRTVGMIGLGNREGGYRPEELEALEAMTPSMVEAFSRKRAEDWLRESEERLRLFIEHAPASLAMFDREMRYLSASRRWLSDYKLGERDLKGLSHYEVFPELPEYLKDVHRRALAGEVVRDDNDRFDRADGSGQWLQWEVRPWHDSQGDVGGIVIFSEDISARKQAEEELRESEARFRTLVEGAPEAIFVQSGGRFVYLNTAMVNLLGASKPEELLDKEFMTHVAPEYLDSVRHRITLQGERGKPAPLMEQEYLRLDGSRVPVETTAVRLRFEGDDAYLVFLRDITQRKKAEEERTRIEAQLRQAQKMEALGTLAGGIAHDFNNILGIITGFTELALLDSNEKAAEMRPLKEVLKAAERAKELVKQILAFSRMSEQEAKPLQVGLIVKEVMQMLRASLPSTIDINLNVASKTVILGDPTQIHQVLMNLCTNAAHAMRDKGGVLEVSLTDVRLGRESIPPHSDLKPGPYVKLAVKDTGCGIDPSIVDRIFDPFFTTKEQGIGTGLGLSVVHGIVRNHGGVIEVESFPRIGTTFQVFLPAMERAQGVATADAGPLPRGWERILVVDDEPALAIATKQRLESLGYEVVYRTNSIEALEIFRLQLMSKPFDLVVTDMTMPYLTGVELAQELLRLQQSLPILLCTGFSEKLNNENAESLGIAAVLAKPVSLRELAGLIRKALDAGAR